MRTLVLLLLLPSSEDVRLLSSTSLYHNTLIKKKRKFSLICEDACAAAAAPVLRGCQAALKHLPIHNSTLIEKTIKFSSYVRKFRWERLQSHIWGRASWYTVWGNVQIICHIWEGRSSPYIWGKFNFLFYQCLVQRWAALFIWSALYAIPFLFFVVHYALVLIRYQSGSAQKDAASIFLVAFVAE